MIFPITSEPAFGSHDLYKFESLTQMTDVEDVECRFYNRQNAGDLLHVQITCKFLMSLAVACLMVEWYCEFPVGVQGRQTAPLFLSKPTPSMAIAQCPTYATDFIQIPNKCLTTCLYASLPMLHPLTLPSTSIPRSDAKSNPCSEYSSRCRKSHQRATQMSVRPFVTSPCQSPP